MIERASGRILSEVDALDRRLQVLLADLRSWGRTLTDDSLLIAAEEPVRQKPLQESILARAVLFTWEALAWTLIQHLRAELFTRRAELPKNDADLFAIFQRLELLDIAEARRLRQFCELRHLSTRDFSQLRPAEIHSGSLDFLPELEAFLVRLQADDSPRP